MKILIDKMPKTPIDCPYCLVGRCAWHPAGKAKFCFYTEKCPYFCEAPKPEPRLPKDYEHCCENCKYEEQACQCYPCNVCDDRFSNWVWNGGKR